MDFATSPAYCAREEISLNVLLFVFIVYLLRDNTILVQPVPEDLAKVFVYDPAKYIAGE